MDPVVHFEIPAQDLERARRFYSRVLGWDVLPVHETYYFAVTTDTGADRVPLQPGRINGGLQHKDHAISTTRLVVQVGNLDEALAQVNREGGTIVRPKVRNPGFWYAIVRDTEGNEINLLERDAVPASDPGER